jgi:PASTA domain
MCVAVDDSGNVVTSTNPAGGASAWTTTSIDTGNQLSAVSCASASLCVAVDLAGNAFASTDPAGGAAKWASTDIDGSEPLNTVSCASGPLCVAGDSSGQVVVSTNPTDGSPTWTPSAIPDLIYPLEAASCPTSSFCMVGAQNGDTYVSNDPSGGASTWALSLEDGVGEVLSVSCPSPSFCVAGDLAGNILFSTNPAGGPSAWVTGYNAGPGQSSLSCATDEMCIGVYRNGYLIVGLSPPSVSLGPVAAIGPTTATLTGTVNPNGFNVTDCHFSYGVGVGSGTPNQVPCNVPPGSGANDVAVSATLTGLSPDTIYSYVLDASNATGTATSDVPSFTTTAAPHQTSCVVPKLKGKTLAKARTAIKRAHCSVGKITRVRSATRNKGHVISQSPKPGKHLKKGAKVSLKVGK